MSTAAVETIETDVPRRLDRLPWSRWHWLVVFALFLPLGRRPAGVAAIERAVADADRPLPASTRP